MDDLGRVLILVIKERVIPLEWRGGEMGCSCLNPSHKGKGDSSVEQTLSAWVEVLILVIKERVIPIPDSGASYVIDVLILVIKERVIPQGCQ